MSKPLLMLAGVAALGLAGSASAQYYQNGWGHRNSYNESSAVMTLEQQLHNVMRSLGGVRPDQRDELRAEAFNLNRQIHMAARDGLSPAEYHYLDVRIGQLERREHWASMNRDFSDGRYGRWHRDD